MRRMRPNSNRPTSLVKASRICAFTLVELLVVIAIISILAGLLLPVLEDAVESARQIDCMSRFRQVYSYAEMYREDNDDWYPCRSVWDPRVVSSGSLNFYAQIHPYLPEGLNTTGYDLTPSNLLMFDPASEYDYNDAASYSAGMQIYARQYGFFTAGLGGMWCYYITNYFGLGNTATSNSPIPLKRNLHQGYPIVYMYETYSTSGTSAIKYNHRNESGTNIVFTDGHVSAYGYGANEMPYPVNEATTFTGSQITWW